MLARTFQVVPGIGPVAERKIWALGADWDTIAGVARPLGVPCTAWKRLLQVLPLLRLAAEAMDGVTLAHLLPPRLHWRVIADFVGQLACVDIETTGLSSITDRITAITVHDGTATQSFVKGENLEEFPSFIAQYPSFATFNGRWFDAPFLEQEFGPCLPPIHLDLQPLLRQVGHTGSLKAIEHELGINRGVLAGWTGETAPWLWRMWRESGERKYRDTLVAYNAFDAMVLDSLLRHAYNSLAEQVAAPFPPLPLSAPPIVESLPTLVGIETVEVPPWADPLVRRTFAGMAMRFRGECGFLDDDAPQESK